MSSNQRIRGTFVGSVLVVAALVGPVHGQGGPLTSGNCPSDLFIPFSGSAVVQSCSDGVVAIVGNDAGPSHSLGAGSTSMNADELYFPQIKANNLNFSTSFNIQNVGSSSATVTIEGFQNSTITGSASNSGNMSFGSVVKIPIVIQNTVSNDPVDITMSFNGSSVVSASGEASGSVSFGAALFNTSGPSPQFLGTETGFLDVNSSGGFAAGIYGGDNTTFLPLINRTDAFTTYTGSIAVQNAGSNGDSIVAIVNQGSNSGFFGEGTLQYEGFSEDELPASVSLTISSDNPDVRFLVVPEPATAALLALGGLTWLRGRRRSGG